MTYQLPLLPGVQHPICSGCKREVSVLAQWAPGSRIYLCRECVTRYSAPDVFVLHDNRIGAGLRQQPEHAKQREQYHSRLHALEEIQKGCVYTVADIDGQDNLPCMVNNDLFTLAHYGTSGRGWQRPIDASGCRMDCPRCQNRLRYVIEQRRQTILIKARMSERIGALHTISLPLCSRCGNAHDRRTLSGDAAAYCQRCDDLNAVESFWNYRGIFGSDDDETILDRIQKSHPGLFERGVLPDAWFILRRKEQA